MKHYRVLTFFINLVSILASFFVAYVIRFGWDPETRFYQENDTLVFSLLSFSYLIVFLFFQPKNHNFSIFRRAIESLAMNIVMAGIFTTLIYMTQNSGYVARGFVGYFYITNTIINFCTSVIVDVIIKNHLKNHKKNIIIATDSKHPEKVIENLLDHGDENLNFAGLIELQEKNQTNFKLVHLVSKTLNKNTLHLERSDGFIPKIFHDNRYNYKFEFTPEKLDEIAYMTKNPIDEVIICTKSASTARINKMAELVGSMGISVRITLDSYDLDSLNSNIEDLGTIPTIHLAPRIFSLTELVFKRLIDILGSLFGCIICIIIGIFACPIIFFQDPGPVIFKQKRIGKNGHEFYMYKFRSMYKDAESRLDDLLKENKMTGAMFKIDNDPRITPFGHFIRKTSLDEFPQFFNVLKGDMSLVGYRPALPREYALYNYSDKRRLAMKPGITGLWQVSGRSDITDFKDVLKLDNYYIDHWSIGLDLKILAKTVLVVLKHKGAE